MTQLRPIETKYNGHLFRSRLEARWAVFFDTLVMPWEYEKQGYRLGPIGSGEWEDDEKHGDIPYLPDFWLPRLDCWIEIKGEQPTALEMLKAARLSHASDTDVFVFFGDIPQALDMWNLSNEAHADSAYRVFAGANGMDNYYAWCECPDCGMLGIEYSGYSDRLSCGCGYQRHKEATPGAPRLAHAYEMAASARFETDKRPRRNGGKGARRDR